MLRNVLISGISVVVSIYIVWTEGEGHFIVLYDYAYFELDFSCTDIYSWFLLDKSLYTLHSSCGYNVDYFILGRKAIIVITRLLCSVYNVCVQYGFVCERIMEHDHKGGWVTVAHELAVLANNIIILLRPLW